MGIHSLSDASFHDVNWKIRPVSIRPPSHYQVLLIFIWVIKVSVHDSSSTVNHPQLVGLTCCPHCSKVNRPRFGKFNQVSDLRFDIVFVDRSASNKPTQQGGWRKITSQIPKGQTVTSSWDLFLLLSCPCFSLRHVPENNCCSEDKRCYQHSVYCNICLNLSHTHTVIMYSLHTQSPKYIALNFVCWCLKMFSVSEILGPL